MRITKVFAFTRQLQPSTLTIPNIPKCGNMRRKMANAVDGCWYSFRNVVPGSFSRYSASWSEGAGLTDMSGER